MLSNAYFLAKIGADTAENEPTKNLLNLIKFAKNLGGRPRDAGAPGPEGPAPPALEARAEGRLRLRDRAAPRAALRGRLSLVSLCVRNLGWIFV